MPSLTVWYDGACLLCRREIGWLQRLDKAAAIDFVDLTAGDSAGPRGCPVDRVALLARFHAREDGRMLSGAAAFAAMWRVIPPLRPLGIIARNAMILGVLERCYRLFLRARPGLQRLAARLDHA